jgi:hypothetical protein
MLSRHRRLLHDLEPVLCQPGSTEPNQATLLHADGYDRALSKLWLGSRGSLLSWHALARPDSRWISCVTGGEVQQTVHYDILTGLLLINGNPLGRLPQEIVEHATYASILGEVSC